MAQVFSAQIDRAVGKIGAAFDIVFRKVSMDITRGVVMKTPVKTGRARGNWQAGIDEVPTGVLARLDPNGGPTIRDVASVVGGVRAGRVFYLANNLPYIVPLEYGHSKQAPSGMVRVTMARFSNIIGDAVASVR